MATYRVYKKNDGKIFVTATIRKVGHSTMAETFTAATKTKTMTEAKSWAARTEEDIYLHKKHSPVATRQRLDDFFIEYFKSMKLSGRKRASTIRNEEYSSNQILRILGVSTSIKESPHQRLHHSETSA